MHLLRTFLALVFLAGMSACSLQQARIDFDPSENYAAMQKWAWMPRKAESADGPEARNDLMERRIQSAIHAGLVSEGLTKVYVEDADFLVAYDTVVKDKTAVQSSAGYVASGWGGYPGYGYGYGRYGGHGYSVAIPPQTTVRSYEEGTLIIDMLEPGDKKLFWRGALSAKLPRHPTPQGTTAIVQDAVEKILKEFPPQ